MEKFRTVGNMLIKLNSNIAALVKPEDRKDVFEDQAKSQDELLAELHKNPTMGLGRKRRIATFLSNQIFASSGSLSSLTREKLYLFILLREWVREQAGVSTESTKELSSKKLSPHGPQPYEDLLILAEAHLEYWTRQGVSADKIHLFSAKDLFEQVVSCISPHLGNKELPPQTQSAHCQILFKYIKVLQFLGMKDAAAEIIVEKLLPNATEEVDYPVMLLCAGAIFKSRGMNEQANEHFFNAAQLGPPKFFNKIEMMIVISRTIEEMGGDDDSNEDAYLMVFEHLKMEGHLQDDADYDEWISNSKTWLDLGDKCAIHQLYSLASDFYGLALLKDLDAFKKPMLWYRFAKSCYRCGKTSDSQLAVRQALAKSPFNLQLMRADRYWTKPPSTSLPEFIKSTDILPIVALFPPPPDTKHLALSKTQAVLRGIQERYNLQLGVGSRTDITRRMTAKVGMMLEDSVPIIIRVKPSWMGKITALRIYDVRNDCNGIVRLKTPFAPIRERHTPRRLSLSLEAIKETVTIRRRVFKEGEDSLRRADEAAPHSPSSRRFHREGQAPPPVEQRVPFGMPKDRSEMDEEEPNVGLEDYPFFDDADAEYEDVEEEFTQLIFKFTDIDTREFSSRRMKIKINLDKLNDTELFVDDLNKYESKAIKNKMEKQLSEESSPEQTFSSYGNFDSEPPSMRLGWNDMSVANKGYSAKYTMSSRRNSTPKFKPKLFFNETRTLDVIDVHEEEDDYNVVTVTNIATCELLSACHRHNNDFYLIHAFNNHDLTTVTLLHLHYDVQIVFLVVREHIDRSNNMKKAWTLLCNIIDHNPLLSMIVRREEITQEKYEKVENPCYIGNIHVFVNVMDRNCGATVILVNPSSTPILSHSFEVLTSTIVSTAATTSPANEVEETVLSSPPITADNSRPISTVWMHHQDTEDLALVEATATASGGTNTPAKLSRSATQSTLVRRQPSMNDFLDGKVKAYSFSSGGSFSGGGSFSSSHSAGGTGAPASILDAIKSAVNTVESAIEEETSEKIRIDQLQSEKRQTMKEDGLGLNEAKNVLHDVSGDKHRTNSMMFEAPPELEVTEPAEEVVVSRPSPPGKEKSVFFQTEPTVIEIIEPEPEPEAEVIPEPAIELESVVPPPPPRSEEEIEELAEGAAGVLYNNLVEELYAGVESIVVYEHQQIRQREFALMLYEQRCMSRCDYRIPEPVKYIIGEGSNRPTLSQLAHMRTRIADDDPQSAAEYVCESIRSEVRGHTDRDAFVFLPHSPLKLKRQPLSKPHIGKQKHKLPMPAKFDTAEGLKRALHRMNGSDDDSLESEGSLSPVGFHGISFELDDNGTPIKFSRTLPPMSKQTTGLSINSHQSVGAVSTHSSQRSVTASSVSTNLLIDQSAAYRGIKKLPLRDSNVLLKGSTMNSLLKLDHIEALKVDNALAREAIYKKSMNEYIKLGYVDCSKPLAYNTHWKRKVNEFIGKFDTMNALKKKIAYLKRLSPVELKSDEAICALAGTNGSIGEVVEKLKNLEYISEVRLVCASIHVKSMLMALMDYDDLSTSIRAESRSLRTDSKTAPSGSQMSSSLEGSGSESAGIAGGEGGGFIGSRHPSGVGSAGGGGVTFVDNNNITFIDDDERSYNTSHSQDIGEVIGDFTHDSEIGYNENPVKRRLKLQATAHSQLALPHMNLSTESRLVQRAASLVHLTPNSPLKHRGPSFSAGALSSNLSLGSSFSVMSDMSMSKDLASLNFFQKKSSTARLLPSLSPKPPPYFSRDDQYMADDESVGGTKGIGGMDGATAGAGGFSSHVPMEEELSMNSLSSSGKLGSKSRSFYQGPTREEIKLKKMTSFRLDDRIETLLDEVSDRPMAVLCRRDALKAQQQTTLMKSDKVYIREHVEDKMTKLKFHGKSIAMNGKM